MAGFSRTLSGRTTRISKPLNAGVYGTHAHRAPSAKNTGGGEGGSARSRRRTQTRSRCRSRPSFRLRLLLQVVRVVLLRIRVLPGACLAHFIRREHRRPVLHGRQWRRGTARSRVSACVPAPPLSQPSSPGSRGHRRMQAPFITSTKLRFPCFKLQASMMTPALNTVHTNSFRHFSSRLLE